MIWLGNPVRACPPNAVRAGFSDRPEVPVSIAGAAARPGMANGTRSWLCTWLAVCRQRRAGRPGGELLPTLRVQNHHRRAASWFRRPFDRGPCMGGRARIYPDVGPVRILSLSALQGPTCAFVALNRSTLQPSGVEVDVGLKTRLMGFCKEVRPNFALSCAHSSHGTAVPARPHHDS
jgi:hypothetical protein